VRPRRARRVRIQLLAEPGAQVMCRILGIVALFDAEIGGGAIEMKPQGLMSIQLRLAFESSDKATRLLTRLRNLVEIHKARMVRLTAPP
jgi:hypothetical protein